MARDFYTPVMASTAPLAAAVPASVPPQMLTYLTPKGLTDAQIQLISGDQARRVLRFINTCHSNRSIRRARLRFRVWDLKRFLWNFTYLCWNLTEAARQASPTFLFSEELARYGSTALSAAEHLTLLVGKESIALMRRFGPLMALSRASFLELWQLLPQAKAEAVIAALSVSAIAESEHVFLANS
jgi:hypothetical protein